MNWQPGDLALCVSKGPASDKRWLEGPQEGDILTVDHVSIDRAFSIFPAGQWLSFSEWPDDCFFHAGFVKITPGTEPQGIEEPRRLPVKEKADA